MMAAETADRGLTATERSLLRQTLRGELATTDGVDPIDLAPRSAETDRLRRRGLLPRQPSTTFTLVDNNGVLTWEEGFGLRTTGLRRGRSFGGGLARGEIIERVQAQPLPLGNEVTAYLVGLDDKWTPGQGLREWDGNVLGPALSPGSPVAPEGKILVLVHGTFSNSERLFEEIAAAPQGKAFLRLIKQHYDKIYAFSHPTVSISPVFNAVELARHFRGTKASVDVVAHSRGGLVVRWWLEVMEPNTTGARRAVLVGSPLDGTSLATPRRLRDVLSWLTNVHYALVGATGLASAVIPFLSVVVGFLRISASITNVVATTPAADAAISLIPGLSAMTRVNLELARLNVELTTRPEYFAVISDFSPPPTGLAVWRFITEAKTRITDAAADLLFQGKNDLVVDTDSMTLLAGQSRAAGAANITDLLDFGTQGDVHHINYFRNQKTLEFIATSFGLH
jgi:hypothetical protein